MGKQCRACLKVKPTTDFKWQVGPQGNKYQDRKCESCWVITNTRKAEAESCATKVCSACKEQKMRDEFHKDVRFIGTVQLQARATQSKVTQIYGYVTQQVDWRRAARFALSVVPGSITLRL